MSRTSPRRTPQGAVQAVTRPPDQRSVPQCATLQAGGDRCSLECAPSGRFADGGSAAGPTAASRPFASSSAGTNLLRCPHKVGLQAGIRRLQGRIFTGSERPSQGPVTIVGHGAGMPNSDPRHRTRAASRVVSRDAGLFRVRTVTRRTAVVGTFASVVFGVFFAHASAGRASTPPSQVPAAPPPATSMPSTQQSGGVTSVTSQPALAPPAQQPAPVAPSVQPQVVSGGS